jgi:hypothetical protein
MRRKTESDVIELWNFINSKLHQAKEACESKDFVGAASHIESALELGSDIHR